MDKANYHVINNEPQQRFEVHTDGDIGYLEYRFHKKDIALMHTFVPEELNGRGIATALAHYALEWAKSHNMMVMVYCPFVGSYIKHHPEYESIVDKSYR